MKMPIQFQETGMLILLKKGKKNKKKKTKYYKIVVPLLHTMKTLIGFAFSISVIRHAATLIKSYYIQYVYY